MPGGEAAKNPTALLLPSRGGVFADPASISPAGRDIASSDAPSARNRTLTRRVNISIEQVHETDGAATHVVQNPFTDSGSRRLGRLSLDLSGADQDTLILTGTVAEARVPRTEGNRYPAAGEEHRQALSGRLAFAARDNRIRGAAELAWSRGSTPDMSAAGSARSDAAWWARLDADLLRGDDRTLSAWIHKGYTGPDYVAVAGEAPADRSELALGGRGRAGIISLEFAFVEFTDNLDRRPDTLTLQDRTASATLGLDLHTHRAGPLSPESLRVTASEGSLAGLPERSSGALAVTIADQRRSGFGFAADWPLSLCGGKEVMTLSVARFEIDDRASGMEGADLRDDSVNLLYTASGARLTGSLSATSAWITDGEAGSRARTQKYSLNAHLAAAQSGSGGIPFWLDATIVHARKTNHAPTVHGDTVTTWNVTGAGDLNGLLGAAPVAGLPPLAGYIRLAGNEPGEPHPGQRAVEIAAGVRARLVF